MSEYKIGPIEIKSISGTDEFAAYVGSVMVSGSAKNIAQAARNLRYVAEQIETKAMVNQFKKVS